MLTDAEAVLRTGIDAAALKPAECDLTRALDLPLDRLTIDYEGREHFPEADTLARLARERAVRVTAPVRADGFDPLGEDSLYDRLPPEVGLVLVAGHPAYLDEHERQRAIAPRIGAALERTNDPWIGTEGVERLALATDATQFELLSPGVDREIRGLREAGFEGEVAVYAPTVISEEPDEILDAVGDYVARRGPVSEALPEGAPTDAGASGRVRGILLEYATEYALVGDVEAVGERVGELKEAGVDYVVGYPARGVDAFC